MLIVLPPSETKRPPPAEGPPVDLGSLSFPELTPLRATILEALVTTSASPDAFRRLQVRPSMAPEVARNTRIRELPTLRASDVYAGPLHAGLDAASLSPDTAARAANDVVIVSSLWGALRPDDRIPPYRLNVCARLVGLDRLEPMWRTMLPTTLASAAGTGGLVLDLRSPGYQAVGMPAGLADRTVTVRITRTDDLGRPVGDVIAKRLRGELARRLLEAGADPDDPYALAGILDDDGPIALEPPARPGATWRLTIVARA